MNQELQKLAQQEWYAQGFAARPIFLATGPSIDLMQKGVAFSYEIILMLYKEDYCKFNYLKKDFSNHAEIIMKKLSENPKYLEEKRTQFNKEVRAFESDLNSLEEKLPKVSEKQLFDFLPLFAKILETAGGTSHLLESISLRFEKDIRKILKRKTAGKELNKDFSAITTPTTESFISKKEASLWDIKNATEGQKKPLVKKFISEFFWIKTSFAGGELLTSDGVLKEANIIEYYHKPDFQKLKKEKEVLLAKYSFTEEEKELVKWTEFAIDWQDDRKEKLFRGIFALHLIIREISKRFNVDEKFLEYLLPAEIPLAIKNNKVANIAKKRISGCVFVKSLGKILIVEGNDFEELEKALDKEKEAVEIITGQSASLGTAVGKVKICTTMESLRKVEEGDILVASMTRPEYVSAMKKAAAIVTDEGGVLCHAAIISRELGIPCVTGTKIATKIFKDGDLLEVRANHGMVKKIK